MRGRFLILLLLCVGAAFSYGIALGIYRIFPYKVVQQFADSAVRRAASFTRRATGNDYPESAFSSTFSIQTDFAPARNGAGDEAHDVFDLLAADMDLDGDPDLFVNRHHRQRFELYENLGGRFRQINAPKIDASGLFDNRGIPNLFASQDEMLLRIREDGAVGLYVWHDTNRNGAWRFHFKGDEADAQAEIPLFLRFNAPLTKIEELDKADYKRANAYDLRITLREPGHTFGISLDEVTVQLRIELGGASGAPPFRYLLVRNALSYRHKASRSGRPIRMEWLGSRPSALRSRSSS